jgi:Family of unknown function (DUF6519)/Right handed beta helix region
MKGDFSQWRPFDPNENFNGVLHQQGRVLTDPDWNEQTRIDQHWRDRAALDVIGAGVAAVPLDEPNGFKVESAAVVNTAGVKSVELKVRPGHAWAGGPLVYLGGEPPNLSDPVKRVATYLEPPIQNPSADPGTISAAVRDAVILEVSRETLNAFQWPDRLIEPALGGPDTTERIQTRLAFRLLRLHADEDCHTIAPRLKDDPSTFGKLTVSLQPTVVVAGDCPVVEGGGYTGFEHQLYRIEIGPVAFGARQFKWSRFNGGLVGRGNLVTGTPNHIAITGNFTAILTSGLSSFYLEIVRFDTLLGRWVVTCGVMATLNLSQNLELFTPLSGALPTSADPDGNFFFRLWDGLLAIGGFTNTSTPAGLVDGIHLAFDAPANKTYREGDYWVFPVRAGEIKNPLTLINAQPPQGIRYHRVPLAELNWNAAGSVTAPIEIEDCRRPFRPLTKLDSCCTYRVGDGIQSFGDFNATDYPDATPIGAIQAAINALPRSGGQVCVLPGEFRENVIMTNLHDITITGCGPRSRVVGRGLDSTGLGLPVIHVKSGTNIAIESLAVEAHETGIGILVEGTDLNFRNQFFDQYFVNQPFLPLINVTLRQLLVIGTAHSAIRAQSVQQLTISECHVQMRDVVCLDPAVFGLGDDMLIERNVIEVAARREFVIEAPQEVTVPSFIVDPNTGVSVPTGITETFRINQATLGAPFQRGSNSRGGIQIGGTSDRVRIINNLIRGGAGTGINLGSLIFINKGNNNPLPAPQWPRALPVDPCDPATPANAIFRAPWIQWSGSEVRAASAGTLTEIVIERNRIYDMGMNGIGVVGFLDLEGADEFITVEKLFIIGNDIRRCLNRTLAPISNRMLDSSGYGGISLADVEQLVIRDNLIADNGPSCVEPICGIFVLHVEGMEISRNRIFNNGARNGQTAMQIKAGRRGGINVVYAVTPLVPLRFVDRWYPAQNGEPALKIEGNVVSAPLGQALSVTALGPISVVANEFTSRGVVFQGLGETVPPTTIFIANLGMSMEMYAQLVLFSSVANGSVSADGLNTQTPRSGLDDSRIGAYLADGNVLFANNQCMLDVLESGSTKSFSSINIFSLDDVAFHGNQCDCSLFDDQMHTQAFLWGISLRMIDNRLKETLFHATYSAITFGLVNMTVHNQTTHCLLRRASTPACLIGDPNTVMIDPNGKGRCTPYSQVKSDFGGQAAQT